MTAEIAILNNAGVALATDSAVTIRTPRGPKIYNSVNKLFALSKYAPVGIMIYGGAEFMTVPWETIIKEYRRKLVAKRFERLDQYADDFLEFLSDSHNPIFPSTLQEWYVEQLIGTFFDEINQTILKRLRKRLESEGPLTFDDIQNVADEVTKKFEKQLKETQNLGITVDRARAVLKRRPAIVSEVRDHVFENLPLPTSAQQRLTRLATQVIRKAGWMPGYSGVVLAGYGEEEYFPSLVAYEMDGVVDGSLRYHEKDRRVIGPDNNAASVVPFAQGEMAHTFMQGIDPSYSEVIDGFVHSLMQKMPKALLDLTACENLTDAQRTAVLDQWEGTSRKLVDDFHEGLARYARDEFIGPVVEMVASLPKDELAAMAEAFVNLHIFKRKVTPETETVGGPIDVAVISKGDGFIWIKRKHYFPADLNPQFFANYYNDVVIGGAKNE